MIIFSRRLGYALALLCSFIATASAATWSSTTDDQRGIVTLQLDGAPFATYHYRDPQTPRPYFANIQTPTGERITRNFPPQPSDLQDHPLMHPGLWLAFGDLSGADNWRLTRPVEHVRFVQPPTVQNNELRMVVENHYRTADGNETACHEMCAYRFGALPHGVLVLWDSRFTNPDAAFSFGDQEEMGLGVRVATSVTVATGQGGRILNANGQRNEGEAWSQAADWCDYSGPAGKLAVGATVMPHPNNFRRAWCHCRDKGLLVMNPFGRQHFTDEPASTIVVEPGEEFRLRYGVLFHWGESLDEFDPAAAYKAYVELSDESPK